jgi:hypothetical protein
MGVSILIVILINGAGVVNFTQEFSTPEKCTYAKEVIRTTTQLKVDTLQCVLK